MNVINELKNSASPNCGNFIQQDLKAICWHDEIFPVNVVCEGQNYPAIHPSLPIFL